MSTIDHANSRYTRGAIALHWTIALLIIGNVIAGWLSERVSEEMRYTLLVNHKAVGMIVLALTVVRIGWRLGHRPSPSVETLKPWEHALSRLVHALFYVLMLAIPLAGWAMSSIYRPGMPVDMFGLFGVPALPLGNDREVQAAFNTAHAITAWLLVALLALHLGAVFKHQFLDRDATLSRMMPWARPLPPRSS